MKELEELTVCYEFNFNVAIQKKKGKQQKKYALLATGTTYSNAVWDVYFTLKKRQSTLISVNSVKVNRIAFALNDDQQFVKVSMADYPVEIPADLNKELSLLPKKNSNESDR